MVVRAIILLCWVALSGVQAVNAAENGVVLDRDTLFPIYQKAVLADLSFPPGDIKIDNFSWRPKGVRLPAGEVEYRPTLVARPDKLARRIVELQVLVAGRVANHIKMSADLHLYGTVFQAKRPLRRDTILKEGDFASEYREITMFAGRAVMERSLLLGRELKKSLRPGDIIFSSYIRSPRIVKRGDMVVIVGEGYGIRVTVPGKARGSGALGELIKVKNMMSRREVYGRIISPKEVRVAF